ncbi:hypothetical protein [Massilia sp. CFBP9026]|uniref:hypothetical protein n=1 Tax=Massilia sp. CFBP9026 TaxID=3096536 RepID=UPI002A69AEB0|nr:hypothetical protein [Massilia sp. CFBP9026]MDY0961823.1 hypothetical protein [Massilia sp. CFBP9026]
MQELAVVIIVSLAALYLGAKYMSASLRARIVLRLTRGGRSSAIARWLDKTGGGGCGGGSCGSGCAQQQSTSQPAPPGKHRVIKLHQR